MLLSFSNSFLQLRLATDSDKEMLYVIYASTRMEELERGTDWSANQKEAFLRSQFAAQDSYYKANYDGAFFWMIEHKGTVIGRLYLQPFYKADSISIIDISILPEWRNRGIGQDILKTILRFAEMEKRSVTIHVESLNPAMNLYKRLGFQLVSLTNGVYHLLEWNSQVPHENSINR